MIPGRNLSVPAALVVLGCLGCDNSLIPDPPATPDRDQADLIGSTLDNHAQDLLLAFNIQEFLLFELPLKALPGMQGRLPVVASCPIVDNDADLDGDGIPDDATFSFTDETCTVLIDLVGRFEQSGSIHIVDSGEAPGYHLTFNDFRVRKDILGGNDYSIITVNGTYDVSATTTTATLQEALVVTTEDRIGGVTVPGSTTYDWTATFTASGEAQVDLSIPLPSGILALGGSTSWKLGKDAFAFNISTPEVLVFDSACAQGPEFLSGRMQAAQTNVEGAFVFLRYTGCAVDPIIQRTRPGN